MNRILLAASAAIALVTSAGFASAAEGKFVFRWKGVVTAAADSGAPGGPSTGEPGNGSGDDGSGTGADSGGDGSGESGDGSGSGGGDNDGDGDPEAADARMALSVRPADDGALREHYEAAMPFGIPVIIASPSGTYGDGDVLTVCWDTEVYDEDGISGGLSQQIQLPPSPLVRAITVGGQRVERDMESFDVVTLDRAGGNGCADLELTVPEADSYGWGMGIPFGVYAKADTYLAWYAHNPAAWQEPDAYENVQHDEGPGWLYLDALRGE